MNLANVPSTPPPRRILATLCTYNEALNLKPMVETIFEFVPDLDILIVDDNSPDGTGQIADHLAQTYSQVNVMHRPSKSGLGTAIRAGLTYACQHNYDLAIVLDADFSHHPKYLPDLLSVMKTADVAVGSRYVTGGGVVGWTLWRHIMSRSINRLAQVCLGLSTKDCSGSYRCYSVNTLNRIDFNKFKATGYAIQEELLYRCKVAGASFREVPIVFEDRVRGSSKINTKEAVMAVWLIIRFGFSRLCGGSP